MRAGAVYNVWTDADHPRGLYRRTSWASYLSGAPTWETVLDVDALAAAEGVPWSFSGLTCLAPEEHRCLVALARGGSDAVELREMDLVTRAFIPGGFRVPEAKTTVAWVDADHLLVATAARGEPVTTSGYAARVRLWERGKPLAGAAPVARSADTDMGMWVATLRTPRGEEPVVRRLETIFTRETPRADTASGVTPVQRAEIEALTFAYLFRQLAAVRSVTQRN